MNIFNLYGQYYDLFYADKDTIGECSYLLELLNSNNVPGKRWLELGAGAGRHGRVFKEKGITWSGLELSTDMAQRGIAEGLDIKIRDIRYDEYGLEKFDAVLALFHVISYMTRTEDVVSSFSNAFHHLKPGGLFFFDVWYTPAVYMQLPEIRIKRAETEFIEIEREAIPMVDWNRNTVDVHYKITIRDKNTGEFNYFEENHLMRHFSLPEIEFLASTVGFQVILSEEWLTRNKPSKETWGVGFLLKKPE